GLVERARRACERATGTGEVIASGALHDAAEVARRLPAAMLFAPSERGISHAREEDTSESDLATAIEAYSLLAADCLGA
ncbi:MAG: M20/M25/M40 family metallo-hydrolase, partial [Solirubrobacterales bacterium]